MVERRRRGQGAIRFDGNASKDLREKYDLKKASEAGGNIGMEKDLPMPIMSAADLMTKLCNEFGYYIGRINGSHYTLENEGLKELKKGPRIIEVVAGHGGDGKVGTQESVVKAVVEQLRHLERLQNTEPTVTWNSVIRRLSR